MMSSDSEQMPRPSKRRKLIVSDSESSDESIIHRAHRKKKVHRVISEAESSDEESDVLKPVIRRHNYKVVSEDDTCYESSTTEGNDSTHFVMSDSDTEWQSDWNSVDELNETAECKVKSKTCSTSKKKEQENVYSVPSSAGFESDSSNEQSEKCPICLLSFKKQQVATPESCDHCFCLDCLIEWSKNINTCPVDRQPFTVIHVRSKLGSKILKKLPVEVKPRIEEQIQEDPTYCEVCQECNREDRMLLCDGCDLGYHLECLTPPMDEVPLDEWYCPECSQNSQDDAEAVEIDLDEITDVMEEARRLGVSYGRTRTERVYDSDLLSIPRVIPRTRQTERVRANIRADRNRAREAHDREPAFDPDQPSTSSGIDSIGENSQSRLRDGNCIKAVAFSSYTSVKRKRTSTKTRKRKSKSKNGTLVREVRITEFNGNGEEEEIVTYVKVTPSLPRSKRKKKKTKNTRKKQKCKRRGRTVSSLSTKIQTVKKRLAITLGLHKPIRNVPLLVPIMKNHLPMSDQSALINARFSSGISQVSLFGDNLNLDYSPPG